MRGSIWSYLLMLALGVAGAWAYWHQAPPPLPTQSTAPIRALSLPVGTTQIADLVERAAPAVVNIDTVTRQRSQMMADPFEEFFGGRSPFSQPREYLQKGVGSGFIVGSSGLIITNHHVVRNATQLTVTLDDGRKFPGRVLGRDPSTDVAVVKIDAKNLPTLPLGPSHSLRVGEWVVAIGSPLGLSKTVTAGIVSALNRDVQISERVSFIQTDAAINPGNSGGPLIAMNGQVIGMNTAIAAQAQGIGFAIPSDMVRAIVEQLETKGKVERAWLGVSIADLTPERAEQMFRKSEPGVIVRYIIPNSPAAKAGLQPGDILLEIDGRKLEKATDLIRFLATKRVGETISLQISREGQRKTLKMPLAAMPENTQPQPPIEEEDSAP